MSTTLEQPASISVKVNCTFQLQAPDSLPAGNIRQGLVLICSIDIASAPGDLANGSQAHFKDLPTEHRRFWGEVEQRIQDFLTRIKPALPGWIVNHISCFVRAQDGSDQVIAYRNLPPCIIPV